MRVVNQMPFTECEKCRRCILSVKDDIGGYGERTVYVSCRHAKKCYDRKRKGEKGDAEQ